MRAFLPARKAHDVTLLQHVLALVHAKRRLSPQHDDPFLVRVMRVVRPEPVAGLELVHAPADHLRADLPPDPGVLASPALAVLGAIPLVGVEVEDLHARGA